VSFLTSMHSRTRASSLALLYLILCFSFRELEAIWLFENAVFNAILNGMKIGSTFNQWVTPFFSSVFRQYSEIPNNIK